MRISLLAWLGMCLNLIAEKWIVSDLHPQKKKKIKQINDKNSHLQKHFGHNELK